MSKILKRLVGCLALVVGLAPGANAQGFVGAPGSVDYLVKIQLLINQIVDSHMGMFVGEGVAILHSLAIVMLAYMLILALFSKGIALEAFVQFVFLYLIAFGMLEFYDSPMPWGGFSFHSMFSTEADWIDAALTSSVVSNFSASVGAMQANAEVPVGLNIAGWIYYIALMVAIVAMYFVSFGVTAVSYVAMGCGSLLGPLLIPFSIWPFMSWIFIGWLRFMILYAMWRVMATAVVSIFANIMLWFINTVVAGDTSLGHIAVFVWPLWVLIFVSVYALWFSYRLASDMVSGSASMGNPMSVAAGAAAAFILR